MTSQFQHEIRPVSLINDAQIIERILRHWISRHNSMRQTQFKILPKFQIACVAAAAARSSAVGTSNQISQSSSGIGSSSNGSMTSWPRSMIPAIATTIDSPAGGPVLGETRTPLDRSPIGRPRSVDLIQRVSDFASFHSRCRFLSSMSRSSAS